MQVQNINAGNTPSFGNLVIKNKKLFTKYGRDVIEQLKNNKNVTDFVHNPDYDLVLSAEKRLSGGADFLFSIRKRDNLFEKFFPAAPKQVFAIRGRESSIDYDVLNPLRIGEYIKEHFYGGAQIAMIDAKISKLKELKKSLIDFYEEKKVFDALKRLEKNNKSS